MTTFTSYLQTNANGTIQALPLTWVQMVNNNTSVAYVSDLASDANGKYTMTGLPAGTYTVNIGPSNVGSWTATGNTSFQVEPVDSSGNTAIPGTLIVTGATTLTGGLGATSITGVVTLSNQVAPLRWKDTAGTAITGITGSSDNIIRVGWLTPPASNGHLILYDNGVEALRFTPGGNASLSHVPLAVGTGDNLGYAATYTGQLLDIRKGTAGSPDTTVGAPLKVNRTMSLLASQVVGDGADAEPGIASYVAATSTSEAQSLGLLGYATSASTQATVGVVAADAGGVYGVGRILAGGTHTGIGGFFHGRTDGTATSRANAIEGNVYNGRGVDAVSVAGGFSGIVGIWLNANGPNLAGDGIEISNAFSQQFDVGLHFTSQGTVPAVGPTKTADIKTDSTAATSILVNGTHSTAAMAIAPGAGSLLIGETSLVNASALLEVKGPTATADPLVSFGNGGSLQAYSMRLTNTSGAARLWVSAGINNFAIGSIAGDSGIGNVSAGKFFHLTGTNTVVKVGLDNSLVLASGVATTAGGASAYSLGSSSALGVYFGSGFPTVSTPQGSLYLRTDGVPHYNTNATTGWNALMPDVGEWVPADYGAITWAFDPALGTNPGTSLTPAGMVFVTKLHLHAATTISNIKAFFNVGGSGLTSGQCFAGLFDANRNLLSATADQAAAWVNAGIQTMALITPQVLSAGDLYVGWFYNGTTGPTIWRSIGAGSGAVNAGISATPRWATADTGRTTTFPSTLSALTASSQAHWVALS